MTPKGSVGIRLTAGILGTGLLTVVIVGLTLPKSDGSGGSHHDWD